MPPKFFKGTQLLMLFVIFLQVGCSGTQKKGLIVPVVQEVKSVRPVLTPEHLAQYDAGTLAMKEQDYASAESVFKGLLEVYPQLAGAWVNLALIEESRSDNESALTHYEEVLKINPNNIDALIQRAHFNQENGRFEAAAQDLLLAEAVDSDNPIVHFNLGVIYELYLQDNNLAIEHYLKYVELSSNADVATVKRWIKLLERK